MITVLSNINLQPISNYIKTEKLLFGAYGQFIQELINKESTLFNKQTTYVFLFIDFEELIKDIYLLSIPNKQALIRVKLTVRTYIQAVEQFLKEHPSNVVILNNFVLPPYSPLTFLEQTAHVSYRSFEAVANEQIHTFISNHSNSILFDWKSIVELYGYNNLFSTTYWYAGRIKQTSTALRIVAERLQELICAYEGRTKKVLILDLDNTLWGGVIGEDGVEGIQLSEEKEGKIFRDFQKSIRLLKKTGVLLCIVSKNNEQDVVQAFRKNRMMILSLQDFIIKKINWEDKAVNIVHIAKELNVSIESCVFIDDNPAERERVKKALPQLVVPGFPKRIEDLHYWFHTEVIYPYFSRLTLTKEDKNKQHQYKTKLRRDSMEKRYSHNDFIKQLAIRLRVYTNQVGQRARIAQLTQKTNQFNFSSKRYTEHDIDQLFLDKNNKIFTLQYEDKFGKEGIVGVAIMNIVAKRAFLDTFLLSCRVLGKNVEYAFLLSLVRYLLKQKIYGITISFTPSDKNQVASSFYHDIFSVKLQGKVINCIDIEQKLLPKARLLYTKRYEQ